MSVKVLIDQLGRIRYLHSDEMNSLRDALGSFTIKRASNVEPDEKGKWYADMSPIKENEKLGPYDTRTEALKAEEAWLLERGYPLPGESNVERKV